MYLQANNDNMAHLKYHYGHIKYARRYISIWVSAPLRERMKLTVFSDQPFFFLIYQSQITRKNESRDFGFLDKRVL